MYSSRCIWVYGMGLGSYLASRGSSPLTSTSTDGGMRRFQPGSTILYSSSKWSRCRTGKHSAFRAARIRLIVASLWMMNSLWRSWVAESSSGVVFNGSKGQGSSLMMILTSMAWTVLSLLQGIITEYTWKMTSYQVSLKHFRKKENTNEQTKPTTTKSSQRNHASALRDVYPQWLGHQANQYQKWHLINTFLEIRFGGNFMISPSCFTKHIYKYVKLWAKVPFKHCQRSGVAWTFS